MPCAAALRPHSIAVASRRTATTVVHDGEPTTSVRLEPAALGSEPPTISFIPVAPGTTPSELNNAVAASTADVICFVPDAALATGSVDPQWAAPLADEALRRDVGAVGPKVVTASGTLASIGRVLEPTLADRFVGEPSDSSGLWGAFFVVREVSTLAPLGFTIARATFEQARGFGPGMSLDVAVADLSLRLAASGGATLIHPGVTLVVDTARLDIDARGLLATRTRHGAGWIEHFDLRSRAEAEWTAPTTYEQLHTLLEVGDIDLVTSDVFDTLVTRPVATPSDLFVRTRRSSSICPNTSLRTCSRSARRSC